MAYLEYIEKLIDSRFDQMQPAAPAEEQPVSDEFYKTLISKVDKASEAVGADKEITAEKPVTENETVADLLEDTLNVVFGNSDVGIDFTDAFSQMLPEDKEEFLNIMEKILSALEGEEEGTVTEAEIQSLIDSILGVRTTDGSDPYDAVRVKLGKLRANDATAEEVMENIFPMLLDISVQQNITAVEKSDDDGILVGGNSEMTLGQFRRAFERIMEEAREADDEELFIPDFAVDAGTVEVPVQTAPESSENVVTPEIPEVTDTTENTQPPVEDTVITEPEGNTETPVTDEVPAVEETPVTEEVTEAPVATESEEIPVESIEVETLSAETSRMMSVSTLMRGSVNISEGTDEFDEIAAASLAQAPTAEAAAPESIIPESTANSVHTQVVDFITGQMNSVQRGETSSLRMTLNPDNLGRITVEVTNNDGEIIIRIAAESAETQSLLRDRLPALMQDLSDINNGVREIQVVEPGNGAQMADLNLSDGQQSQTYRQNDQQSTSAEPADEEEIRETTLKGENRLWQMA